MVGISRNTLFRWLKDGVFEGVEHRDWRGWRLFTEEQINKMKAKTCQISSIDCRHTARLTERYDRMMTTGVADDLTVSGVLSNR